MYTQEVYTFGIVIKRFGDVQIIKKILFAIGPTIK